MNGGEVFYQRFFKRLVSSLKGPLNPEGGHNTDWPMALEVDDPYEDYQYDDFDDSYEDYYDRDEDDEDYKHNYDDSFSRSGQDGRVHFVSPDWEVG